MPDGTGVLRAAARHADSGRHAAISAHFSLPASIGRTSDQQVELPDEARGATRAERPAGGPCRRGPVPGNRSPDAVSGSLAPGTVSGSLAGGQKARRMSSARRSPYELTEINKYLLPREEQVATLRQHWALLVPPAAAAVGAVLAAEAVTVIAPSARPPELVAWILAGFLVARLIVAALSWFIQYITVTNARVVLTSGLFSRKVKIIPLPNFAEMTFARSFAGRMIGFGTFMIEASGKAYLIIDYIPYSEQIQLILIGRVFPESAEVDWDLDDAESPPSGYRDPFRVPAYRDYGGRTAGERREPPEPGNLARADTSPDEGLGDRPGAAGSGDRGGQADEGDGPDPGRGE